MADIDQISNMEKIQKQLAPPAGSSPMQGYLLKRSETLRLWNQRWFTLNPTTGKMEYRIQRGDSYPRGLVFLEADSVISLSPINFHGDKKYDGCCFYIGSSKKREYFLCAETPGAARAWVATLRAAALVLKAHREAVNSLTGISNGTQVTSVASAAAIANATARESEKEVTAANRKSVLVSSTHLFPKAVSSPGELGENVFESLKDQLKEKDEEILKLKAELKARDDAIADLSSRLSETADSAEAAANAARAVSMDRNDMRESLEKLKTELELRLEVSEKDAATYRDRESRARTEIEQLRNELLRVSERSGKLEAGLVMAEGLVKEARSREAAAEIARQEALRDAEAWRIEAFKATKFVSAARSLAEKVEDPSLQAELAEYSRAQSGSSPSPEHPPPFEANHGEFRIEITPPLTDQLTPNPAVEPLQGNSSNTIPPNPISQIQPHPSLLDADLSLLQQQQPNPQAAAGLFPPEVSG